MTAGRAHATLAASRREGPQRTVAGARRARPGRPPAVVAAVFSLAQLLPVGPRTGLGWDETVYVSQVGAHAPAAYFSAPRARGVSLLVAPVASRSSSTALLRCYLAVLSGLALFLALRAWRGLFPVRVLTLAGALFAFLWVTLFHGPQAMPNYWVAVGAPTAVARFLRARADRTARTARTAPSARSVRAARVPRADRAALWGLAASGALMAWTRPVDAVWIALPLLALGVARRQWRTPLVLLAGLTAGAAEWVVEAYASFGGLARRLSVGSDVQGGLGLHLAVGDQLRSLGGRALCRPCTGSPAHPVVAVWWFVLPLLAVCGLAIAVRARRTTASLLPLACAVTAAFPYLFLIGYAAPRFLLPAYALCAIPVADALGNLAAAPGRARRPFAVTPVACALAAHLAVQLLVLIHTAHRTTTAHRSWSRPAAAPHVLGVRPPCLLTGHEAIPGRLPRRLLLGRHHRAQRQQHTGRHRPHRPAHPGGHAGHPGLRPARDWPFVPLDGLRLYYAVPRAGP